MYSGGWNAGLSIGPLFGNRKYHAYFYEVAPEYATPSRPAYSASGGYSGSQVVASLCRRFERFWIGGLSVMTICRALHLGTARWWRQRTR